MASPPDFEFPGRRSALARGPELLGVHALGEFVYCPRAGILAMESTERDVEPELGPRLDGVLDYNDHRFAAAIRQLGQQLVNLACLVTVVLAGIFLFWRWFSPAISMVWVLPLAYLLVRIWENSKRLIVLVGAQGRLKAAPELAIDWTSPEPQRVSWWTLRKAGYDCLKPVDPNVDRIRGIVGKPWRVLTKEPTQRIPVIRKHLGNQEIRPQHFVRLSAYSELLTAAEGVDVPFGVVVLPGSETCLVVVNTPATQQKYAAELVKLRTFLTVIRGGSPPPPPPVEAQCRNCPHGKLRKYSAATALTDSKGRRIPPRLSPGQRHSPCGDRFGWDPPQGA